MSSKEKNSSVPARFLCLSAIVVALTLVSGTIYGKLTQRWGPSEDLVAAAEHVRDLPKQLGQWRLLEEGTMPETTQQTLQCAGYVNRQYVHDETGKTVSMAVIVGPPGPTAVHTPEICYSSRAYKIEQGPEVFSLDGSEDSYWATLFQSQDLGGGQLQVYYAWSDGQGWLASQNPRVQYGGSPLLYKIQVSASKEEEFGGAAEDSALDFIQSLSKSNWSPQVTLGN